LSRIVDKDDWEIPLEFFLRLDASWGPHTVYHFASFYNTKLPWVSSHFWNSSAEAVDIFTCDWSGENKWLCPRLYLIPRATKHAIETGELCTLTAPRWLSAPFWPMLFPNGQSPTPYIAEVIVFNKSELYLVPDRSGGDLLQGNPNTDLLAVRIVPAQGPLL